MDRNYLFPLAIATVIHLVLMFGFPKATPPARPPAVPVQRIVDRIKMPPPEEEPEPVMPDSDTTQPSPEPPAPHGVDIPVLHLDPQDFTIPVQPAVENVSPHLAIIPPGATRGVGSAPAKLAVFSATDLDRTPHTLAQVQPAYPYQAMRDGRTGHVTVEFTVDENGRVHDPRVTESSDPVFNEAALRAVLRWRFEPGRRFGHAVQFRMVQPFDFTLQND